MTAPRLTDRLRLEPITEQHADGEPFALYATGV